MINKKLPVGIDDFETLIKEDYYYIDKTEFIKDWVNKQWAAELIMRPTNFGKSLNMSMFKAFLDPNTDKSIFDGLAISKEKEICDKYMGKYPVIFISFKNVTATNYQDAYLQIKETIIKEASSFKNLLNSEKLSKYDAIPFKELLEVESNEVDIQSSLFTLSRFLQNVYGQYAMILIDDYDVPFDNAYRYGYYRQMYNLLMGMFGWCLKGNNYALCGILTGYLPLYNESIISGFNNYCENSFTFGRNDDCFGFTDEEVRKLLKDYNLESHYQEIKQWYGGYQFASKEMYNPNSVINYCNDLLNSKVATSKVYRKENGALQFLFDKTDNPTIRSYIHRFLSNEIIGKYVDEHFSRYEIDNQMEKIWSLLYMAGYLTTTKLPSENIYSLRIPNKEISLIIVVQTKKWFYNKISSEKSNFDKLFEYLQSGNTKEITNILNDYLFQSINYYCADQSYYYDFLLTILNADLSWIATVNDNSNIILKRKDNQFSYIIKLKVEQDYKTFKEIRDQSIDSSNKKISPQLNAIKTTSAYSIIFHEKACIVKVE